MCIKKKKNSLKKNLNNLKFWPILCECYDLPISGSTFPEWIRIKPNDTDPTGSGSEKQFLFVYLVQK